MSTRRTPLFYQVMKLAIKILLSTLWTYFLLEFGCFVLLHTRSFNKAHFPTFTWTERPDSFRLHIAEIRPEWGMWHYPGETFHETQNCLNYTVHANSYGARDKERVKAGDSNRIVMLGDSFIEGWGEEEPERLSDRLEAALHKEVLNFGCGMFTPTQEYLTYKYLAKDFSHDVVIWAILPFNDFNCDDTSYHEDDDFVHYQPFFEGVYPNYRLLYRVDNIARSTFNKEDFKLPPFTMKQRGYHFLSEFTFWFNIVENIRKKMQAAHSRKVPSQYYDYKPAELNKLFFIIKKLQEEANGKKLILLTLPVLPDFERYRSERSVPLKNSLDSLAAADHFVYVDMLTNLALKEKDPDKLFFKCDAHWNAYANQLAAQILLPLLK